MICIAFQNKYSHRLQKLFEFEGGERINQTRLKQILDDIQDYSEKILFGMISGVVENEEEVKQIFESYGIETKTPAEVLKEATDFMS